LDQDFSVCLFVCLIGVQRHVSANRLFSDPGKVTQSVFLLKFDLDIQRPVEQSEISEYKDNAILGTIKNTNTYLPVYNTVIAWCNIFGNRMKKDVGESTQSTMAKMFIQLAFHDKNCDEARKCEQRTRRVS